MSFDSSSSLQFEVRWNGRLVGLERHTAGRRARFGGSHVEVVSGGVVVDGVRCALHGAPLSLRCGPFDVVVSDVAAAAAAKDDAVDLGFWKTLSMALILVLGTVVGLRLTPKYGGLDDEDLFRGKRVIATVHAVRPPPTPTPTPSQARPMKAASQLARAASARKTLSMKERRDNDRALALAALRDLGLVAPAASQVFARNDDVAGALAHLRVGGVAGVAGGVTSRDGLSGGTFAGINGTLGDHSDGTFGTVGKGNIDLLGHGKSTATVRSERVIYDGSLDREEIQRVLSRAMAQFRYCYEKELNQRPNLEGKLTTFFTIGGSGDVVSASALQSTLGSDSVDSCVLRILQRLKFPSPRGGGVVQVTYPFVFSAH